MWSCEYKIGHNKVFTQQLPKSLACQCKYLVFTTAIVIQQIHKDILDYWITGKIWTESSKYLQTTFLTSYHQWASSTFDTEDAFHQLDSAQRYSVAQSFVLLMQ